MLAQLRMPGRLGSATVRAPTRLLTHSTSMKKVISPTMIDALMP